MEIKTHWKKLHNPNYLGSYAFQPGKDIVSTIKMVQNEMVIGSDGKKEECTVMHFAETGIKPMIVNATNAKQIQKLFKTPYIEEWRGRKIQLYVDCNVRVGKEIVEGIRVRPFPPKEAEYKCADCEQTVAESGGKTVQQIVQSTQKKYGVALCGACATKRFEEKKKEDVLSGEGEEVAPC